MPEQYVTQLDAGTEKQEDTVDAPSSAYLRNRHVWDMLDDLLGGTEAMRNAEEKWLPREEAESESAYQVRLKRSILYNAFGDTVERLSAKPFAKPVTTEGELPEQLKDMLKDVDRNKRDITTLGKEMLGAGVTYGLTHLLVDYPNVPLQATLAEEKSLGAQPTYVHVKPTQLIGWRTETKVGGEERLVMIRIMECKTEPKGKYLDQEVRYVRVYTDKTWELWRENVEEEDEEKREFVLKEEGTHTFGEVPLLTFYVGKRTGFMEAEPPLLDLAWLNIAHWQSLSDQRNILRFVRMGILFASGFSSDRIEKGITIGPNNIIADENSEADLKYVEHSGAALGAGQTDLDKTEERMEVMGLQPLVSRNSDSTATGKVLDEASSHTDIQSWIRGLETVLEEAFEYAAQWVNAKIPDDFKVDINNEFGLTDAMADVSINTLLKIVMAGKIDDETFLNEVKRRGMLADSVEVQKVLDKIAEMGPPPGLLTAAGNPAKPKALAGATGTGGGAVGKGAGKVVAGG